LSLSVSARIARVTYVALTNAYWSPHSRQHFPLPDLPLNRLVGLRLASLLFGLARPFAFALHTRPLNQVRRAHGLPSLGYDLRRVYTDADFTLYADIPEMVPCYDLPATHNYLGPVLWSPNVPFPDWWDRLPTDRPCVYVTLGSSGQSTLLPLVLDALAPLYVTVIGATAGGATTMAPSNAHLAAYLPGSAASARSSVVICNGGSPTSQQALAEGVPVLGIASNLDQFLNMEAVRRAGAGILLRSDSATPQAIRTAVQELLGRPVYRETARELARVLARYPAPARFTRVVEQLCEGRTSGAGAKPVPHRTTAR